jgi:hypothetical protein
MWTTSVDTQVGVELLSAVVSMEVKPLQQYIEHLVGTKSAILLGATSMQKLAEADGGFSVVVVVSSV